MNVDDARAIAPWCAVVARDAEGKANKVYCPAHTETKDGKRQGPRHAIVTIDRKDGALWFACRCYAGGDADEGEECKARGLCYHELAALAVLMEEAGVTYTVRSTRGKYEETQGQARALIVRGKVAGFVNWKREGKVTPLPLKRGGNGS